MTNETFERNMLNSAMSNSKYKKYKHLPKHNNVKNAVDDRRECVSCVECNMSFSNAARPFSNAVDERREMQQLVARANLHWVVKVNAIVKRWGGR